MVTKQVRWTRGQARRVVDELERSGLTVAAFARDRNLHPKRIREWQRRLEEEDGVQAPRMVELVAAAAPTPCSLKLRCPSGHVLEVTGVDLAEGALVLLAALGRPGTC